MSDSSSSDDDDLLLVYTDVSDDDGDTYSRGSTSEVENTLFNRHDLENAWRTLDEHAPYPWPPVVQMKSRGDHDKKDNPGVLYLPSVPPGFNVSRTIVFFSQFGKVGRVFLKPDKRVSADNSGKRSFFSEGWVEFIKKEDAQEVAKSLHNSKVEGNYQSEPKEVFWRVKYLPEFLWLNLWEKLSIPRDQSCPKPSLESCEVADEMSHTRKRRKASANNHIFEPAKQYDFRQKEPETDVVRVSKSRRCKLAAPEQKQAPGTNRKSKKKKKARKSKKRKQEKMATDQALLSSRGMDDKPPPSKRARNRSSERRDGITVRH